MCEGLEGSNQGAHVSQQSTEYACTWLIQIAIHVTWIVARSGSGGSSRLRSQAHDRKLDDVPGIDQVLHIIQMET